MLWFLLWTVLVVAALAVVVRVLRDLWRSGKRFVGALDEASARLSAVTQDAEDRAGTLDLSTPRPVEIADRPAAVVHRAERREATAARRAARAQGHEAVFARWRALSR